MNDRMKAFLLAAMCAPLLHGQGAASRVGIAAGYAIPTELHAANALVAGLNVYFRSQGRLRLEGVTFGPNRTWDTWTTMESKGSAVTLGCDWMPGNGKVRAILGIGAMAWSQTLGQQAIGPNGGASFRTYGGKRSGASIVPAAGVQVRLTRQLALEARYAAAINTGRHDYNLSYQVGNEERPMSYFAVSLEYRFPRFH
ncbi:hypothetical protein [Geothrix sp. 21YS21S-2]|uniref:hypothetical protein n=1 Tax=Geothrix sp. 21YS21S-2 TaxID=3068893 RepID=UPI0027B9521C|nr:hypothetical protein [Geothrix sp. 21YS21S-2]